MICVRPIFISKYENRAKAHFIPNLNAHVPQDNGIYEANEKQDLSTS